MILVVGGGIAGLSLAWYLLKVGRPVTVVERAHVGAGASGIPAIYLEPRPGHTALRQLERVALESWPEFAAEIEESASLTAGFRRSGMLRIACEQEAGMLRSDCDRRRTDGWQADWLERKALAGLAPGLSQKIAGACHLPAIPCLDGQQFCRALARAITARGGKIFDNYEVRSLLTEREKVIGLHTENGELLGDKVVLCGGFGTGSIAGLPSDVPQQRPVRGIVLGYDLPAEREWITVIIKQGNFALIPSSDRKLFIGGTHEDGETSASVSTPVIARLHKEAVTILPALADLSPPRVHCAIRALVGDGLIRLGRSRELGGLYYSLSHAGAGFLRAPVVAREFASFISAADAPAPLTDKFLFR